jgi:hypothetical protein
MSGFSLVSDGKCIRKVAGGYIIPNGTYTSITYTNGCVTAVGQATCPGYTPPSCSEATTASSSGGAVTVSPNAQNWLANTTAGLLVTPNIAAGTGITTTGSGTAADPLVISAAASSGGGSVVAVASTAGITVSGDGSAANHLSIGLVPTPLGAGTYSGFTVDAYGRVTNYTASSTVPITQIMQGTNITVTPISTGIVQISAVIPPYVPPAVVSGGSFTTADGKTVIYNSAGTIVSVV